MPQTDFNAPRLFVDAPMSAGVTLELDRNQANYLGNVLRLNSGDSVLVFNGRDGEWQAAISGRKRLDQLTILARTRPQDHLPDLHLVFAPLKHARLDYMVQKAVEMGASALRPVMTRFTQVSRVNLERMRANIVEAAEQCGILNLAVVHEPLPLEQYLTQRDQNRRLLFCDERAPVGNPVAALSGISGEPQSGIDLLIGPEGGFAEDERTALLQQAKLSRLSLGPRILRADTAAVAAMTVSQAMLGDWGRP